jgi:hypothetical protein
MRAWVMLWVLAFAAVAGAAPLEEAKRHFYKGVSLAHKKNFGEALVEFETSYRLNAVPEVLINIALCDKALGRYADAIEHLEHYIADSNARSKNVRAEVNGLLGELRAKVASESPKAETTPPPATVEPPPSPPPVTAPPAPTPPATSPAQPPPPVESKAGASPTAPMVGRASKPTPFLKSARGHAVIGIGAVALALFASSAVTGGIVLSERDRYRKSCDVSCDESLYNHAHNLAVTTDVMLALGGAAAITSLVVALTRPRAHRFAAGPTGLRVTF